LLIISQFIYYAGPRCILSSRHDSYVIRSFHVEFRIMFCTEKLRYISVVFYHTVVLLIKDDLRVA